MNKTYAITDLHGVFKLWKKVVEYIDETDIIYFLGDANDRGDDGIKIIKELLLDKRVIYIRGNHEQILMDYIYSNVHNIYEPELLEEWFNNGGLATYNDLMNMELDEQWRLWTQLHNNTIFKTKYINANGQEVLLSHAGTHIELWNVTKNIDFLWDRKHIDRIWFPNKEYENIYLVHGHTPTMLIKPSSKEVINYYGGHKFDIDIGSFWQNKVALFDLDTFETTYLSC